MRRRFNQNPSPCPESHNSDNDCAIILDAPDDSPHLTPRLIWKTVPPRNLQIVAFVLGGPQRTELSPSMGQGATCISQMSLLSRLLESVSRGASQRNSLCSRQRERTIIPHGALVLKIFWRKCFHVAANTKNLQIVHCDKGKPAMSAKRFHSQRAMRTTKWSPTGLSLTTTWR